MHEALDTIISETFTVYAGVLIEKKGTDFIALKHLFSSIEAANVFIDQSFENIKRSLTKREY